METQRGYEGKKRRGGFGPENSSRLLGRAPVGYENELKKASTPVLREKLSPTSQGGTQIRFLIEGAEMSWKGAGRKTEEERVQGKRGPFVE